MRTQSLELRDLEMLRTILRLRFVPTRLLNAAFFSDNRNCRRRLQRLSDRDLIRPHSKGVERSGYTAWRLTARGRDQIVESFPDEPILDDGIERAAEMRLRLLFHHEALCELYLRLVAPEIPKGDSATKPAACRKWSSWVRRRADYIGCSTSAGRW
jgi:hypothetical protein